MAATPRCSTRSAWGCPTGISGHWRSRWWRERCGARPSGPRGGGRGGGGLPLRRERWLRPASVHLAIALGVALLHSLFEMGIQHGLGLRHSPWAGFTELSIGHAPDHLSLPVLA